MIKQKPACNLLRAELRGTYQERQAAQEQILLVAIGAAVAILLLLQSAFRNWRMTMLAFVALPTAVVGGIRLRLRASTGQ